MVPPPPPPQQQLQQLQEGQLVHQEPQLSVAAEGVVGSPRGTRAAAQGAAAVAASYRLAQLVVDAVAAVAAVAAGGGDFAAATGVGVAAGLMPMVAGRDRSRVDYLTR